MTGEHTDTIREALTYSGPEDGLAIDESGVCEFCAPGKQECFSDCLMRKKGLADLDALERERDALRDALRDLVIQAENDHGFSEFECPFCQAIVRARALVGDDTA